MHIFVVLLFNNFCPVLLRNNWHIALYKFKVYSIMTYIHCEIITTVKLNHSSSHIDTKKRKKIFLLVKRGVSTLLTAFVYTIHQCWLQSSWCTLHTQYLLILYRKFVPLTTFTNPSLPPTHMSSNYKSNLFLMNLGFCILFNCIFP